MKLSINFKILWDSIGEDVDDVKFDQRETKTCIHSGNAGDIIYSLPTVKELGVEHYVINLNSNPAVGGRGITFETAKALAPLLLAQPYIGRVTIVRCNVFLEYLDPDQPMEGIDYVLDRFRLQDVNKHHLAICHALAFGVHVNLYEKWLHVDSDEESKDYIVVALTPRYRSLSREFWIEVLSPLKNIVLLGIPQEYHCVAGIRGDFVTCKDFLEMAKIIREAKLFIGNPSLSYAIAEGLKVKRLVELPHQPRNAYPIGENGYVVPNSVEEARRLIEQLICSTKPKTLIHTPQDPYKMSAEILSGSLKETATVKRSLTNENKLPELEKDRRMYSKGQNNEKTARQIKSLRTSYPKVSIIMPVFNNLSFTRNCLEALYKVTPSDIFELVIVDNGSTDDTKFFLKAFKRKHNNLTLITNEDNQGFAKACNQGAKIAKGKYLVFLNNDTIPLDRWLDELLKVAESDTKVGVVGAKLLYPNGKIQHAGIELINGIPDHPYRFADPGIPEVNHQRELDMVTGACMLIKKELFDELGGFDEAYKNGMEDVDLCLRVREKGFKVIYCPKCVLYHYEGVSKGRFDHLRENLILFFNRWGKRFDEEGRFIRDRSSIIWEGSQFVYHSLALINREVCLQLIKKGHDVSIIPYEPHEFGPEVDERFKTIEVKINKPLSRPDVHVRHQWPPNFNPPPEGHWVMIQPWEYGVLPQDWIKPMSELVDEIWVPSRHVWKTYVRSGVPPDRVVVIPNGVNLDVFNPHVESYPLPTKKKFRFLFVGGTIWRKGIDILLTAYSEAFTAQDDVTLIIKDMGQDSFYCGQEANDRIRKVKNTPNMPEIIYITDTLTERQMASLYKACHCLVHPYRGEGFCLPALEAMACGVPVIVTRGGATDDFCKEEWAYLIPAKSVAFSPPKNMRLVGGYGLVLEPDKEALKSLMRHVYDNYSEAKKKAKLAFNYVSTNLTWDKVVTKIEERIRELKKKPIRRLMTQTDVPVDLSKLCKQGEEAFNLGEVDKAITIFKNIVTINPSHVQALNNLALIYWQRGELKKSLEYLYKAMKIDPEDKDVVWNCGQIMLELGKAEDAYEIYKCYLQRHPQEKEIEETLYQIERLVEFKGNDLKLNPSGPKS
ncbi:MAG TPA: glycosyltransferase [Desulfobacterales bacterium]|nr:glycosyltransferase [Desulfobacterales bacterium]